MGPDVDDGEPPPFDLPALVCSEREPERVSSAFPFLRRARRNVDARCRDGAINRLAVHGSV